MNRPRTAAKTVLGPAGDATGILLIVLALAAATFLAYLPALHAGYVWDDDDYVLANPVLRDPAGLGRIWFEPTSLPQYYPLVHTTFWIEYRLFGLEPGGYHAVNVALHALGAALLYLTLRRLGVPAALPAAAIFALHPVQVESVAWITERKNVLSNVFYLLAFLAWLRWRPIAGNDPGDSHGQRPGQAPGARPLFYILALGAFAAALLSKTVTFTLPAAILLVIWWKRGRLIKRDVAALLPFFALGIGLALVTALFERGHVGAEGVDWSLSPLHRVLIAGRALFFYAGKLIWPARLTFNYPRWTIDPAQAWQYIFPVAALAVLMLLIALRRRMGRGPAAAALFFAGTLAPALGFFNTYPMIYSFVADHFQYQAAIGLIALGCALALRWGGAALTRIGLAGEPARRTALAGAAVLICAVFGALTWQQAKIYRDAETLWTDTLAKNPSSWLAAGSLGGIRLDQAMRLEADGRQAQAAYTEARRLTERALAIREFNPYAHNNLGMILLQTGDPDGAQAHLEMAIQQRPDYAEPHNNYAVLLWRKAELQEAEAEFEKALAFNPAYLQARRSLALLSADLGRTDRAIALMGQVLAATPGDLRIRLRLAGLLMAAGRSADALLQYRAALRVRPDSEEAQRGAAAAEAAMRESASGGGSAH